MTLRIDSNGPIDFNDPEIHPYDDVIDLSGKELTDLPEGLFSIEGIKSLFLGDNHLKRISERLVQKFRDLEVLDLSGNIELEFCPDLSTLKKLQSLILPCNGLSVKVHSRSVNIRFT